MNNHHTEKEYDHDKKFNSHRGVFLFDNSFQWERTNALLKDKRK